MLGPEICRSGLFNLPTWVSAFQQNKEWRVSGLAPGLWNGDNLGALLTDGIGVSHRQLLSRPDVRSG